MRNGGAAVLKLGDSSTCEHVQGQDPIGTVTPLLVTCSHVLLGDARAIGREDALMGRA